MFLSGVFCNLVLGGIIQNVLVRFQMLEMAPNFIKKKKKNDGSYEEFKENSNHLLLLCCLRNLDFCPL